MTLDRGTLEPVKGKFADLANKSYPCPGAAYGDSSFLKCTAALATVYAALSRIDPESFFGRYSPKVSTLDHYPERDTPTGWCVFGPLGCTY